MYIFTKNGQNCFRYSYRYLESSKTWIEPETGTNDYNFDEIHLHGAAQLAIMNMISVTSAVRVRIGRLYGDKSGFLHVGYNQTFRIEVTDPDIPFGLRVYENGSIEMPRRAFVQNVNFRSSGKVS